MGIKKDPATWRGLYSNLLRQLLPALLYLLRPWSRAQNLILNLGGLNVRRCRTFRSLLQVKCYLLTFGQALEAAALNGGMMHEDILAAVARGDETKTFSVVKPLHCSCCHEKYLYMVELRCFAARSRKRIEGVTTEKAEVLPNGLRGMFCKTPALYLPPGQIATIIFRQLPARGLAFQPK